MSDVATNLVRRTFKDNHIEIKDLYTRDFPNETIIVIEVRASEYEQASKLAEEVDHELARLEFNGFTTIKKSKQVDDKNKSDEIGLNNERVSDLVQILTARARTTESQPSLEYIVDSQNALTSTISDRHHLIFGRRGAGKTALLAETKRIVTENGNRVIWINSQTYRQEGSSRLILAFMQLLCEELQVAIQKKSKASPTLTILGEILDASSNLLADSTPPEDKVKHLVPRMQRALKRSLSMLSISIYIIIDDFHYMPREQQPLILDLIHGCVRDCNAWLKVASIQHLTRWYDRTGQLGLESGHDAEHIDLDITLQSPEKAKNFCERMLLTYVRTVNISRLTTIYSASGALDRLILGSGAVPRDYLSLCSIAIRQARKRKKAKLVGIEDVNKAAGEAKAKKLAELEDDAASAGDDRSQITETLERMRRFCIEERNWTCFRIDFIHRDRFQEEYQKLQLLVDLRFLHLIEPSLPDERIAGRRSEVYMLDLSQYAGQRLKRRLQVLDFTNGYFVVKKTGTSEAPKLGDTPTRRLALLRRIPEFGFDMQGDQ